MAQPGVISKANRRAKRLCDRIDNADLRTLAHIPDITLLHRVG